MKYILRSLLFALMVFISQLSFAQKKFAHPERVRYDGSCMTIEGKDVFIVRPFIISVVRRNCGEIVSARSRRPDLIRSRLMSLGTGMKGPCRLVWTIRLILIFLT